MNHAYERNVPRLILTDISSSKMWSAYAVAEMSVYRLVKFTVKYILNFFIAYRIYKTCSKLDLPYFVHNSQLCNTILQIDWHNSVMAVLLIR